jgi:hypothetical protein
VLFHERYPNIGITPLSDRCCSDRTQTDSGPILLCTRKVDKKENGYNVAAVKSCVISVLRIIETKPAFLQRVALSSNLIVGMLAHTMVKDALDSNAIGGVCGKKEESDGEPAMYSSWQSERGGV